MYSEQAAALKESIVNSIGYGGFYFLLALVSISLAAILHELIALVMGMFSKKDHPETPDNTKQTEQEEIRQPEPETAEELPGNAYTT